MLFFVRKNCSVLVFLIRRSPKDVIDVAGSQQALRRAFAGLCGVLCDPVRQLLWASRVSGGWQVTKIVYEKTH